MFLLKWMVHPPTRIYSKRNESPIVRGHTLIGRVWIVPCLNHSIMFINFDASHFHIDIKFKICGTIKRHKTKLFLVARWIATRIHGISDLKKRTISVLRAIARGLGDKEKHRSLEQFDRGLEASIAEELSRKPPNGYDQGPFSFESRCGTSPLSYVPTFPVRFSWLPH